MGWPNDVMGRPEGKANDLMFRFRVRGYAVNQALGGGGGGGHEHGQEGEPAAATHQLLRVGVQMPAHVALRAGRARVGREHIRGSMPTAPVPLPCRPIFP
jgi:hypothetical protein